MPQRLEVRRAKWPFCPGSVAQPNSREERVVRHRRSITTIPCNSAKEGCIQRGWGGTGSSLLSQPLPGQAWPIEPWTWVILATWGHVGMTNHAFGGNCPARHDAAHQSFQRCHLRLGKGVVSTIVQLYADGARVYIITTTPLSCPGVPGPHVFSHHLPTAAVSGNQVMRRHLGCGITQPLKRLCGALHRGIVQHDQ